MINLELPRKLNSLAKSAEQAASGMLRPISRKYDLAEHAYPKELDILAAAMEGRDAGSTGQTAGAMATNASASDENSNGANMGTVVGIEQMCWGDVGLLLTMPRAGLGNAALAAVASDEQKARFKGKWAAMAITEPSTGSDSASISTTATLDGDHYVLNGEKIFVTSGKRADMVVVWATLDKGLGRAAIKSFAVEWGTEGMDLMRLEHKLGIRASDTAAITFTNCRVHKDNLLGNPEIDTKKSFAGVMQTFDNTRPMVAAMGLGVARASLELTRELLADQIKLDYTSPLFNCSAVEAELYRMEAELESARLLTLKSAWMADNRRPNSMEASMGKAKAGRVGTYITLRCVELCSAAGYEENELLEKWARDSKIIDIFEGTQQIQQLIVARRILGIGSSELK